MNESMDHDAVGCKINSQIFLSIGPGQSWYATRMSSFCDMLAGGPTWTRKTRGWERETDFWDVSARERDKG